MKYLAEILVFLACMGGAAAQNCSGKPGANTLCAGPASGGHGFPAFRGMVSGDIGSGTVTGGNLASGAAASNVGSLGGQLTGTLPNPSIAAGTVTNSNLSNMSAGTVKCRVAGGSAGAPQDCSQPVVNVIDYGATGNGSTDDTTAIQNAINALPANGGEVDFPQPSVCYKTSSSLQIGNGNSTPTPSTINGIILRGIGNPTKMINGSFPLNAGPEICGTGFGAAMIQVNGPLEGWGVQNLYLNCASAAGSIGILVLSGIAGDSENDAIFNCSTGIFTKTYTNFNTMHNFWRNVSINVPNIGGGPKGLLLDGNETDTTSNTTFEHYENLVVVLPGTGSNTGIYLKEVDSLQFFNTQVANATSTAPSINFDYTGTGISGVWPASVNFFGLEVGSTATAIVNSGTPGTGATPNYIVALGETNGPTLPNVANLTVFSSHRLVMSAGGNTANTELFASNGHLGFVGTAPTLTGGCNGAGSSVISGSTDITGTVETQSGTTSSCTLTFNTAYANPPICIVSPPPAGLTYTTTDTTLTLNYNPGTPQFFWNYHCFG